MRFDTMYQDLMRFLRAEGLDEKIIEGRKAMLDSGLDINGMFNERGTFLGTTKNNRANYLKRGRFYLAQQKGGAWSIFYVNPVDWLRPYDELGSDELAKGEGIGLVHIGWDGINLLIDNPQYNPNQIGTKGWNYTYADIEAIEEYRGTAALENYKKQLIRTGHTDEYGFDYYRQDGFVFYELPQLKEQLGVFNWWW